jgi:glycosyltransferase involved in cell wall biosynthesis
MIHFSLVVPCYNDAGRLRRGVERLRDTMAASGLSWEFIFVEDHSRDNTAGELRSCVDWLESQGVAVSAIYHERNQGHGGAISSGIRAANGDIVGYVELDLSLAQGLAPLIQRVRCGEAAFAVGKRVFTNPAATPIRFINHWLYIRYAAACLRLPVTDPECRLKVFRRSEVLPLLDVVEDQHCFWDTELLHRGWRAGVAIVEEPVAFAADCRAKGAGVLRSASAYRRAMVCYRHRLAVAGRCDRFPTINRK